MAAACSFNLLNAAIYWHLTPINPQSKHHHA